MHTYTMHMLSIAEVVRSWGEEWGNFFQPLAYLRIHLSTKDVIRHRDRTQPFREGEGGRCRDVGERQGNWAGEWKAITFWCRGVLWELHAQILYCPQVVLGCRRGARLSLSEVARGETDRSMSRGAESVQQPDTQRLCQCRKQHVDCLTACCCSNSSSRPATAH